MLKTWEMKVTLFFLLLLSAGICNGQPGKSRAIVMTYFHDCCDTAKLKAYVSPPYWTIWYVNAHLSDLLFTPGGNNIDESPFGNTPATTKFETWGYIFNNNPIDLSPSRFVQDSAGHWLGRNKSGSTSPWIIWYWGDQPKLDTTKRGDKHQAN
jgi:hypothetical protein